MMRALSRRFPLLFALVAGLAQAGGIELIRAQPLLAEPRAEAAVLAEVGKEVPVELLQRQGGWLKIRAKGQEGWVRLLAVRRDSIASIDLENLAGLLKPGEGAGQGKRITAVAGLRSLPRARPSAHALILAGAPREADAAVMIANGLGVPEAHIVVADAAGLGAADLRKALDGLAERVAPGDQVFVYYSGQAARLATQAGCTEAIVAGDGQPLAHGEIAAQLGRLGDKARRVVSFFDTRRAGAAGTCSDPLAGLSAGTGIGAQNYLHIAAQGSAGEGLATRAWLDCLGDRARDTDASGALSVAEVQACAQDLVGPARPIAVSGNRGMVFGLAADAALPAGQASPAALATLRDLYANRDDRRRVSLQPSQPRYRILKDRVGLSLESSHPGYAYILMVGSDGSSFDMLFPNRKDPDNRVRAGETLRLPRNGWDLLPGGPAGTDHLLVIVSDAPRDFSGIGMQPAGPFSMLSAGRPGAGGAIQQAVDAPEAARSERCKRQPGSRALSIVDECSEAYGAALIGIDEVE